MGTCSFGRVNNPRPKRGQDTGPSPTDRGKPGTKHHIIVDQQGIPLAAQIGPANEHDSLRFDSLLDAIPAIRGKRGRPRSRPDKIHADKAYDALRCRQSAIRRGIQPRIARRGVESKERLGRHRWVVERTFAWLHQFKRLRVRYERRSDIHLAFLIIGCLLVCFRWFC